MKDLRAPITAGTTDQLVESRLEREFTTTIQNIFWLKVKRRKNVCLCQKCLLKHTAADN